MPDITKLKPGQEVAYNKWKSDNKINESDDYDMKGYWKEKGFQNPIHDGHFPDTYKLKAPFSEGDRYQQISDESKYSGNPGYLTGNNTSFDKRGQGTWNEDNFMGYKHGTKSIKMKTYKGKYKKAANGLQSVAVPEQGSETGVLSSAVNGASMGAQIPGLGPFGAIAGAAAGVGLGFLQKRDQDAANAKAVARNKYVDMNDRVSATDSSIDQKAQVFRAGGNVVVNGKPKYRRADGKVVKRGLWSNTYLSKKEDGMSTMKEGTKMIEIEGKGTPEIHTDKNFNIKNLGTTPHTKGGNKVEASEGDVVFNTQNSLAKYNKIAAAIKTGDKATLTKEKNRLPEDSGDKNQDGNGGVKKSTKSTANPAWNYELPKAPVASYAPNSATQAMRRLSTAPFAVGKNIANGLSNANAQRDKDRRAQYEESRRTEYSPIRADLDKQYLAKNAEYDAANKPSASTTTKSTPTTATTATVKPKYKSPTPVNDFFSKGVKSQVPTAGVKPKGVAVAGKKIAVAPPKVATPIAAPTVPGTASGNFMQETLDGNNVPLTKPMFEPKTPVTNTVTPPDPNQPTVTTVGEGVTKTGNAPTSGIANNLAQFTGVANNLIQGIKPERPINQQYFDPQLNKYTDRSESLRQQSTSAANIQNANARNVSGGNAGNMRANQDQAALGNLTRQGAINEQEMTRRDAVDVQNNGLKNQASQYNLQRKDMYQGQIDGTRAAKQAYMDQAASDIGQYGLSKREEQYMRDKDDKQNATQLAGLKAVGTSNFNRDINGNKVTTLEQTPTIPAPTSTFPTPSDTPAFNSQTLFTGKQTPKQKATATTIAPPAVKIPKYTKRR